MSTNGMFGESNKDNDVQTGLGLDDGTGLRVVSARFLDEQMFDWDLFDGYDTLRVLTYSASINAIVRMLDNYSFTEFECVFGYEGTLGDMKDVLAFQKVVVEDTRAAIMGLKDERHVHVLRQVRAGQARFRVLRKHIAHAKLYLLSSLGGHTRVIIGSANLSERAFSGSQSETLVKFDDDDQAWRHYNRMFDELRNSASDEIPLPEDRILNAEIEISETPVMADTSATLVIEPPSVEQMEEMAPVQISRVEKVKGLIGPRVSAAIPAIRNGKQRITPEIKRVISRIRLVKSAEDADNRYLSIDRTNRLVVLSGERLPLEWDREFVRKDATLLLQYFRNFADAFEGNVPRLQQDYFTLMAWLYFSPFICDMRSLALLQDSDVIRYPTFAIIFGKSNCGKTSLVDTLMTSMFGYAHTIDKRSFTTSQLRGLQQAFKRFPVVFDDIGRRAFNTHGRDMIKDEMLPPVTEYPGFMLSMNAEPQSFPDEIVKRSMMIYTTTALPPHNEELRQRLQGRIQEMRRSLSGHLYRRYLTEIMDHLDDERLPEDWLALSSSVLSSIISDATKEPSPRWCQTITWFDYAERRYDRVKARLDNLLRISAHAKSEGASPNGWTIEGGKIIVWEQRDAFGRRGFDWEDVPSTLIDDEATSGGRTVLHRESLEEFLGRGLRSPQWWKPW